MSKWRVSDSTRPFVRERDAPQRQAPVEVGLFNTPDSLALLEALGNLVGEKASRRQRR